MDYLPEGTLEDLLKYYGKIPIKMVCNIARSMFRALLYSHGRNIIHRDLKPCNIFIRGPSAGCEEEEEVTVCLGDFGLSCNMVTQVYELDIICGTPGYIDPEVLSK